ncbi:MAG TPA: Hsp70 family protein, partial [Streptomyces sp.]|nr:Hsp70 family protein [Streptomyces sp.]
EREIAAYNKKLGMFELTGLPPAPRGVPQIEVAFDIDANGIMHVTAKDLGTGKEQKMTVTGGSALPKDDIDRMVRDAEQHAQEDRRRREAAETRNTAEQLVHRTEKLIAENESKIPGEVRSETEAALAELKGKLEAEAEDAQAISHASDRVAAAAQKVGSAIYSQAAGQQSGAGASDGAAGPDGAAEGSAQQDVVDAEIVDEDDASRAGPKSGPTGPQAGAR